MPRPQPQPVSFEEYESRSANLKTVADVGNLLRDMLAPTLQRLLEVEMSEHLGYAKYEAKGKNSGNSRNGHSKKTINTSYGETILHVPRDRNA
jgi:transposase-like protein